tara:strand:+ start:1813 stop:1971 length:159 start_codon:yes stop_codon:yes gene_type:complete
MNKKTYTIYLLIEEDDKHNLPITVKQRKVLEFDNLEEAEQEAQLILDEQFID